GGGRRIDESRDAIRIDSEDPFRSRFQNELHPPAQSRQLLCLTLEGLALPEELHEDADLCAQHFRMERLEDVIDRSELVAAEDVGLVAAQGGQKNDGRVARFVTLTDQAGGLESIEIRHLHVEQDD